MVIFSYTGSPQVKISQKVLGGATFLTHTVGVCCSCCEFTCVPCVNAYWMKSRGDFPIIETLH